MPIKPTDSELEILTLIWQKNKATVREIHEALSANKDTGYTTTLKLMQIMHGKGLLGRDEEQRTHVYYAAIDKTDTQKTLVDDFVSAAFGGSAKNLVMQALGQGNPSKEEIDEIRALLDKLQKEQ